MDTIKHRGGLTLCGLLLFSSLVISCQHEVDVAVAAHNQLQVRCEKNITMAVGRFNTMQHQDTIDFASIAPFEWDTVYVFEGNTSGYEVATEIPHIDWHYALDSDAGLSVNEEVPEDMNRYVFVRDKKAIEYIDIPEKTVRKVQFSKYYRNEREDYSTSYTDAKGEIYSYTVNHFSREQSKFILVKPAEVSHYPTFLYCSLSDFLEGELPQEKKLETDYIMHLHSLSGCGLPNCLGNDSTRQRIGILDK